MKDMLIALWVSLLQGFPQERARIYMNYIICNYFIYPYIYIHKYLFIFCQLKTMNWRLYFNFQSNISGFILVFPFSIFVISASSSNKSNPIVLKICNYFIMSLHMYPVLIKAIVPLLSALPIPHYQIEDKFFTLLGSSICNSKYFCDSPSWKTPSPNSVSIAPH